MRKLPSLLSLICAALPCSGELIMPDQLNVSGGGLGRIAASGAQIEAETGFPLNDLFEGTVTFRWTMKWDAVGGTGGTAAYSWASFQLYSASNGELAGLGNQWESAEISTFREPGDTGFSRSSGVAVAAGVEYPFTLTITYHAQAQDTAVLSGGGFVNQALKPGDWGFDHIQVRAGNGSNQVDFTNMSLSAEGVGRTFDRESVPEPVFPDEGYLDLYWTAWEQAYAHIKSQEGLPQSPYMDEAFWDTHIWIWDTAFMTFFTKYSPAVFPGVQSLKNFYGPMHDGIPIPLKIQHPDNPPMFAWSEFANWRANDVVSQGKATPQNLSGVVSDLERHYDWFNAAVSGQNWGGANTVFSRTDDAGGKVKGFRWNGVASGMDNTPRGRSAGSSMLWLDAISQQALSALYVSRLAGASGDATKTATWRTKYEGLKATINQLYWSQTDGIYYDIHKDTGVQDKVRTPASYWPMLAELCSEEQALALAQHARQPSSFGGSKPWVTVARNDPDFRLDTGRYWRGSIWLPTAYMSIKALEAYGYQKLADETAAAVVRHMLETYRSYSPATIWECYNPRLARPATTADGSEVVRQDFCGWSAVGPISLFIENILGFHDIDAQSRTVRWRLHQPGVHGIRRLKFGDVLADIISDGAGSVTVDTNLPFTLVINGTSHAITGPRTVVEGIALPDPPVKTSRVEAEDGILAGGASRNTNHTDYSGTGFVGGFDSAGVETITLEINSPRQGVFPVSVCYSRGETSPGTGMITISVNGGTARTLALPNTSSWDRWMWTAPLELELNAGLNSLVIGNPNGAPGICNIDCLEVSLNNRPPAAPALDRKHIPPGLRAGTAIANLGLADPDAGDQLRALIISGGDHFRIEGGKLVLGATLPEGEYPLTIRCADWGGAFTDAEFTISAADGPDGDNDGMDDLWEEIHGLNSNVDDSLLDPDHDGVPNRDEYTALTDPHDGSSFFHISSAKFGNGSSFEIRIADSSPSRWYTLISSSDLGAAEPWSNTAGIASAQGNGGDLTFTVPTTAATMFFRGEVAHH